MLTSEASYLKSLDVLVTHFMAAPELDLSRNSCVIPKRDHLVLFSNVHRVRSVSKRYLVLLLHIHVCSKLSICWFYLITGCLIINYYLTRLKCGQFWILDIYAIYKLWSLVYFENLKEFCHFMSIVFTFSINRFLNALEKIWKRNCILDANEICDLVSEFTQQHFDVYVKYCSNQVYQDRKLVELK